MNFLKYCKTIVILAILALIIIGGGGPSEAAAQQQPAARIPQPRQEKLLNGLRLLIWNQPQSDKVMVKLRIHSGAAFDPKDKMGVMALLADILFPTEESRAYFSEDLGGGLDIRTTYDYLQITASGKAEDVQSILETLATAVTNPQITQDNFLLVRNARLEKVRELEKNVSYVADRAVAKRLFGDFFPYGRPVEGTSESLAKIDRVDLLLARDRYFTADNATVAVAGNVKPDFIYRAVRQLLGAWKKAESKIPATFRQPDAPEAKILFIDSPAAADGSGGSENAEIRLAVRGVARNDKDFFASSVWTNFAQSRLQSFAGDRAKVAVATDAHVLPGTLVFKITAPAPDVPKIVSGLQSEIRKMLGEVLKTADFSSFQTAWTREKENLTEPAALAEYWLDADTFNLPPVAEQIRLRDALTTSDPTQVASRLLANAPAAIVIVGRADTLKATVDELNKVSKN